jgi:hypothetical protein
VHICLCVCERERENESDNSSPNEGLTRRCFLVINRVCSRYLFLFVVTTRDL